MYTLKSIARRSTLLGAAGALLVATVVPSAVVLADALNPLTERSLLLTSSAPGYVDTDGSGNSASSPNSIGQNYAPAGSGPNGKKSGETFTFTHSSTAAIEGFSLQYCTTAAGLCQAPGNNTGDGATRESNALAHAKSTPTSDFEFVGAWTEGNGPGQYEVRVNKGSGFVATTGWTLVADNLEDSGHSGPLTGKNNYVTLAKADPGESISSGDVVEIRFRPSETVYITNPGADEFFVKINTYSDGTSMIGNHNDGTPGNPEDTPGHTVVDGGVTVANVMTDSIHITTKVLETMSFSVGTQNRDTVTLGGTLTHGKCDPINTPNNNRLSLGDQDAEFSLSTGKAHDVYSYWRLSSNSSGGASVYYSGDTLRNTVGDSITHMPTETESTPGMEQFGLGFVSPDLLASADATRPWLDVKSPDTLWHADYENPNSYPFRTLLSQQGTSQYDGTSPGALQPQSAAANYDEAEGTIDDGSAGAGTAKFRFVSTSQMVPELIAQQNETVISCATAKMRYVANIGADTPAGVYTTKINYLAAPQY